MKIPDDIVDIQDWANETLFNQLVKDAAEQYDAYLIECFEKCGISKDYIFEHSEEFSAESSFEEDWKTYKWKGEPLFTVYTQRSIEDLSESHSGTYAVLKCQQFAEFYPGKRVRDG